MLKTDKILRLKSQHGRSVQVVREHYLRENVPCYSDLCLAGCQAQQDAKLSSLPSDVTHYILPDCQVAREYMEVLEASEITAVIFLQTVVHSVQHEGSRRLLRRLNSLVRDPHKHTITFYNEFQKYAYSPRSPGEALGKWQARVVYSAAVWYYNHLAGQMPVVLLTQDPMVVEEYGNQTGGVYVMRLDSYLETFWSSLPSMRSLYESLTASLQESTGKGSDYKGYLPMEVLEAGLKSGKLTRGTLQVNRHNSQREAFLRQSGVSGKEGAGEAQDLLVLDLEARNRAVHGDSVVVDLLPRSQWRGRSNAIRDESQEGKDGSAVSQDEELSSLMPTARVVGILQRNWRDYVVSLSQDEESQGLYKKSGKILVIPFDWRIPKIRISTRQVDSLKDQRFTVRIDSWETGSQYPNGHFVHSLGPAGDLETEISALLIEHQLSAAPFSEGLLKELPVNSRESPWSMDAAEVEQRRDLRDSHLVFSIDPRGCEDVDDTLSVRRLDGGRLELGVHIADVTHFVTYNSLTDLEARSRSTTVYLADRRYDMLPAVLSADLCSLVSGVDRYSVSVIWELDEDYEVVNVWYGRTIIRSAYKLYYELAQELHDGTSVAHVVENVPELHNLDTDAQKHKVEELRGAVTALMDVARHLKVKRTREGALELEGSEVKVEMADSKEIQDLVPRQSLEIHETIAECMIFANHWVAKKICGSFANQALLRRHPVPRQEHFEGLLNCAAARGFEVRTDSNKALAESLNQCEVHHDPVINKVLRSLATQAMSNAQYFSTGSLAKDQFFHYGLALDFYTHFTSPIRRYADVVVHRLLLAALDEDEEGSLFTNKQLHELCDHMNKKHREAQNVQKDSVELFQTLFFKDKEEGDESRVVDAVVLQIRANGLMVFVPRYSIRGAVYLRSKDGLVAYVSEPNDAAWTAGHLSSCSNSSSSITVHTLLGEQTYALLDHVTVRVTVQSSHAHASGIRLELMRKQRHLDVGSEAPDSKVQKAAIIKEVTAIADDQKEADNAAVHLGPEFRHHVTQYGQTEASKSLYVFLQSLTDTARLDV